MRRIGIPSLALLCWCTSLAACSPPPGISIPETRLESNPDRYAEWVVRVHLRGGLELVPDETGPRTDGPVLRLQRSAHKHPVVSCAVEWGSAGGMPPTIAGPGGSPFKRVPIHHVNHVIELERVDFTDDALVAYVPLPAGAGHRYFVRRPGLECPIQEECTCIHPGHQQLNEGFWIVVPRELIYRFSGRDPSSAPPGSAAWTERWAGGPMGSALGVEHRPSGTLDPPGLALRRAASGQDSLALADLRAAMTEVTRNQVIPHDALFDHFVALLLIHVAGDDFTAAADAAAHLLHFEELDLNPAASPEPGTPLASFFETRGEDLLAHWPEFLAWMGEQAAGCPPGGN